ncbi:carboxyltransferase domain-containing protein [Polyangium sp. 6x1]|uniref:5-oxoprolinase subunit B/C family protein n=1 Tax=Polyangium sp. 6x1 TaxID=3042689 RepID=UPI002482B69B|nr:carboxyltransferase domain-containing protein [Polyangium sp. 6x1]MDI1447864.1 carboxyltransferase domain-containing protein [Polyangium sp. 6x1]
MSGAAVLLPYGESAVYVDLGVENAPDRAARTHAAAAALREVFPGSDVVVGGGVVVVANVAYSDEVVRTIEAATSGAAGGHVSGRTHVIPVVYDGPDLEAVAGTLGVSTDAVVRLHAEREVTVELVGFLPGFGYCGPIDARLVLPRRGSPRPRVPTGSVGIAGTFTGIYPFDSPGGWNLLGRAPGASLFDPGRDPPILFAPGDRVRFEPVAASEVSAEPARKEVVQNEQSPRALVIEAAPACATVQDGGRAGQLARGLPPSGPLDPETHAAANEAVGNARDAAAIEVPLGALSMRARGDVSISVDGAAPVHLADGDSFRVEEGPHAVRYLAARGGIDVPVALGARATLLVARLGGAKGRALRRRDVVPVGDPDRAAAQPSRPFEPPADSEIVTIVIDEGPHRSRFPADALDVLLASTFTVSRLGDRVGQRLEGAKIPRDRPDLALPIPMLRGAVQVTTDGTPIVLGPDHPTTGGYPVLAVVRRSSLGALARRRPGTQLRFVRGS